MQKFIIERDIPGAGSLERQQLREAAARPSAAVAELAPDIQGATSPTTRPTARIAKDEAVIREHAEISGFPANEITPINKVIDSSTAG